MEESNESGSSLVISFANDQDVGDYVCEVSSNPPATLRHSVSLIGKKSIYLNINQDKKSSPATGCINDIIPVSIAIYLEVHISKVHMFWESRKNYYVCEVSLNPPATLRHSVSLIGKKST